MNEMETLSRESNFDAIGKIVANPDFLNFENAATLLVRSDLLTSDEKVSFIILCRQLFDYQLCRDLFQVALGTIKRYGLVADALIMLGGLSAELKAGGIDYMPKTAALQASIEDEDEGDEEE